MLTRGVDYSSTQSVATAVCLKAAGIDFVCRYYDDSGGPITEYFNGVDEAVAGSYPIGVYGGYPVCAFAKASWPAVRHYWQTVAWSGGRELPGIDLYQYETDGMGAPPVCGVSVDNNYG